MIFNESQHPLMERVGTELVQQLKGILGSVGSSTTLSDACPKKSQMLLILSCAFTWTRWRNPVSLSER